MMRTPDLADAVEHAAFFAGAASRQRAKLDRLIAKGQLISLELAAFAAASRARLSEIDRAYPEHVLIAEHVRPATHRLTTG